MGANDMPAGGVPLTLMSPKLAVNACDSNVRVEDRNQDGKQNFRRSCV